MFRSKNSRLAERATEILTAEKPMTLRQLYYRCLSAGLLTNAQKEYKRLGAVMTRLREDGHVPLTWIVDHVRATLKPSSWSGLADFGETVRGCYRKDFWESLDHHVEVFVEKDAIAGTIQPITSEYDVALRVCRGYSSLSFVGEISRLWKAIKKPIFAYYLGDFDPSGFDLERDLKEKLEKFSYRSCIDAFADHDEIDGASFRWERLAVQHEDFAAHDLIALPVKRRDMRAAGFLRNHGEQCAEVDALPPGELRSRIKGAILSHVEKERWNRLQAVEEAEKDSLAEIMEVWRNRT